jgi:hypothetical protein
MGECGKIELKVTEKKDSISRRRDDVALTRDSLGTCACLLTPEITGRVLVSLGGGRRSVPLKYALGIYKFVLVLTLAHFSERS